MKNIDKSIIEKCEKLLINKLKKISLFYDPTESERAILGKKYHWMNYKNIYPTLTDDEKGIFAYGVCQSKTHKKTKDIYHVLMIDGEGSINESLPVCFECWNNDEI